MQSILELQRQNEEIKLKAEADQAHLEEEREESRKKVEDDLQLLREKTLKERERLRTEAEDTHHQLEEAIRQQEQLQKQMRTCNSKSPKEDIDTLL